MPQTNILTEKDTQKHTVLRHSHFQTDSTFLAWTYTHTNTPTRPD